jgi:hypothetical protein
LPFYTSRLRERREGRRKTEGEEGTLEASREANTASRVAYWSAMASVAETPQDLTSSSLLKSAYELAREERIKQ